MGYQALLFCPDEKLARVVSQVFGELDFIIEPVHEPFAAVKKLMAQRFDAVVVDCENEQNASLLFKSARNSSFNQSSLAIALVEGQAGVAKAYRIGANLVLTKPINVEQAKGTLRVARGLLRKNSDAAGAGAGSAPAPAKVATASTTTPTPTTAMSNSIPAPNRTATASAPPPSRPEPPVFETPLPAMAASVKSPEKIAEKIIERPAAPQPIALASRPSAETETQPSQVSPNDNVFRNAAPNTATPALASNSVFPSASGSAAAPAPAKELAAPFVDASKPPAPEPATPFSSSPVSVSPAQASPSHEIAPNPTPAQVSVLGSAPTFGSMGASDTPSFGTLGEEDSEASGRKKKMMIAAAIVLAVAVLGYFGYGMLGKSAEPAPTPQPVSAPQNSSQPAPAILPMSAPSNSPATGTPARSSATTQPVTSKPTIVASLDKVQAAAGSPTRIAIDPQPANGLEPKKPVSAPIVVKSNLAGTKTQVAGDDAAPVLTEVASANDNKLTGLMSSTTASLSQPSLATLRISQGVSQGLVIKRVQPKYPAAALAVHAQGAVLIEATISKDGSVLNPKVLKGDAVLARAAVEAVRQWRYKPYYLDGAPVEIQTQITVNFKAN